MEYAVVLQFVAVAVLMVAEVVTQAVSRQGLSDNKSFRAMAAN